jgi:hypothetical protein
MPAGSAPLPLVKLVKLVVAVLCIMHLYAGSQAAAAGEAGGCLTPDMMWCFKN